MTQKPRGHLELSRTCRNDVGTSIIAIAMTWPYLTARSSAGASWYIWLWLSPLGPITCLCLTSWAGVFELGALLLSKLDCSERGICSRSNWVNHWVVVLWFSMSVCWMWGSFGVGWTLLDSNLIRQLLLFWSWHALSHTYILYRMVIGTLSAFVMWLSLFGKLLK